MSSLLAFQHIFSNDSGVDIALEQLGAYVQSGLPAAGCLLQPVVTGGPWPSGLVDAYQSVGVLVPLYHEQNDYEFPTLEALWKASVESPEAFVLYFHTKGASARTERMDQWRRFLEWGVLEQWELCVRSLTEGFDAVGPNFMAASGSPHFSGNFWWARASYVSSLPMPQKADDRYVFERWIYSHGMKAKSIVESSVNHYDVDYPPDRYR